MESVKIVEQLREIVIQNLIQTQYNKSDDHEFQKKQIESIFEKINLILVKSPELKDLINKNMQIVPTIHEVGGIEHMQNIGSSANEYLEIIEKNPREGAESLCKVVSLFLNIAREQAWEFCVDYEKKSAVQVPDSAVDLTYLEEYRHNFEAFIQDANARLKKLRDETEAASNRAKSEAETAKSHALEAEKTAKKASESAQKATKTSQKATSILKNATVNAGKAIRSAKEAQKSAEGIVPNMLTVLGIFVAIVIAVVACYLSVLLANQYTGTSQYTLPVVFLHYLIMGHIMIMVVFLLLYLVSKLTSRPITTHCGNFEEITNPPKHAPKECDKCINNCSSLVRFRLQYTYIFVINMFFFVGYFLLGIWHTINVYYREEFDGWIEVHPLAVCGIISGCLIAFIIFSWILFHKKTSKASK